MMNVAIIIGISIYSDSRNNLPGCKNDAEAVHDLIKKTEKFEEVLFINEQQSSAKTKEILSNYIAALKGQTIEELFLYYSGHGEFMDGEFYFVLSDYDSKRRRQTCLANSEMDNWMRTLAPKLVIKVIDACQSGTMYIKETNAISKYFNERGKHFEKCYFLNSSLNSQASYQNEKLSFFTYSFLKAIKEHEAGEVRYKDIIDAISDDFSNNVEQTPFFVVQADYTEKFCTITADIKSFLINLENTQQHLSKEETPKRLADLVKSEAKKYVTRELAHEQMELIKSSLKRFSLGDELSELYVLKVEFFEQVGYTYSYKSIVDWIRKNPGDYFVKFIDVYDQNEYGEPYETTGFLPTVDLPFHKVSLDILSKYANIKSYNCTFLFLVSRKKIRFFYCLMQYTESNWDQRHLNTKNLQWVTHEIDFCNTEEIKIAIDSIELDIQEKIKKEIETLFDQEIPGN